MLLTSGIVMLITPSKKESKTSDESFGIINIESKGEIYLVNLWITIPIIIVAGFAAGMVGVSGGSFLVPLMVLACGVPMHTAIG